MLQEAKTSKPLTLQAVRSHLHLCRGYSLRRRLNERATSNPPCRPYLVEALAGETLIENGPPISLFHGQSLKRFARLGAVNALRTAGTGDCAGAFATQLKKYVHRDTTTHHGIAWRSTGTNKLTRRNCGRQQKCLHVLASCRLGPANGRPDLTLFSIAGVVVRNFVWNAFILE